MNNSNMIIVEYKGPTNTRGARIQLKTYDIEMNRPKKITLNRDYSLNPDDQVLRFFEESGLKAVAHNSRSGKDIYLFQWDYEAICKVFGA